MLAAAAIMGRQPKSWAAWLWIAICLSGWALFLAFTLS